jgi:hypothetical protein
MNNATTKPALAIHIGKLEAQASEYRKTIRAYSDRRAVLQSRIDALEASYAVRVKIAAAIGFGAGWILCLLVGVMS